MWGDIYTFELSGFIKEKLMRNGLGNILTSGKGHVVLQNATLYSDEKEIYSCCSHEGYTSYADGFEDRLAEVCCKAIENADCYRDMLEVFKKTGRDTPQIKERKKSILSFTHEYILEAGNASGYCKPRYSCTFTEYKRIAKKYLQKQVFDLIKDAKSFKELHPNGYPQHLDEFCEREKFKDTPEEIAFIKGVDNNLFYLRYIADKYGTAAKKAENKTTEINIVFSPDILSEAESYVKGKKDT